MAATTAKTKSNAKKKNAIATVKTTSADVARRRLVDVTKTMNEYCIGQSEIVEQMVLAWLTGEHLVMVGPPGSNKTRLVDTFLRLTGSDERSYYEDNGNTPPNTRTMAYTFKTNLNKFSPPEELIGPPDLDAMMPKAHGGQGKWAHALENGIADADFAFLDEVFSANGATLISLVRILNERQVHNGTDRLNIRLRSVFAATNDEPLPAIYRVYDRFLFHVAVGYMDTNDTNGFNKLVNMYLAERKAKYNGVAEDSFTPYSQLKPVMHMGHLDAAQREIAHVHVPKDVIDDVFTVRADLASKGIQLSERRYAYAFKALQAAAWLRNDDKVEPQDIWTALRDIFWVRGKDREVLYGMLKEYKTMTADTSDKTILQQARNIFDHAMKDTGDQETNISNRLSATATLSEYLDQVRGQGNKVKIEEMMQKLEDATM